MNVHVEALVAAPLDRLEVKGRRYLLRRARRAAIVTGLRRGSAAALAVSVAVFGAALAGMSPSWVWLGVVPLAGLAVGALVVLAVQRGVRIGRSDALATLDRQLATADRIGTTDEFAALPARDGFRQAAIEEAMPWIENALTARVEGPARARLMPERAVMVMAIIAVVLTVFAVILKRPDAVADAVGPAVVGRSVATDTVAAPAASLAERLRAAAARVVAAVTGAPAAPGGGSPDSAAKGGEPGGKADAGTGTAGGDPRARREAAAGGEAAASRQAGDRAPTKGGSGTPAGSAANAQAGQPGATAEQTPAGDKRDPGQPATSRPNPAQPVRPASASRPGVAPQSAAQSQAPARAAPPSSSKGSARAGDSKQVSRGSRRRPGQSPSADRRGTPGGSGVSLGSDAIKRSRGAAALMLAVPMDDRVAGSPGPGRSTSILRPSRPRGAPAPVVAAGDRGVQNGTAGSVIHRATSAQDDMLVRDYFLQRNGQAR